MAKIKDHTAQPGPGYYDWRCLNCGGNVTDHIGIVGYLWRKLLGY